MLKDPPKQPKIYDANLIRREIYNPNNFDITFRRMPERLQYVATAGINPGPYEVKCPAGKRCILNHAYYVAHSVLEKGQPLNVIEIYGDEIGKGHTKPSMPFANRGH